VARRARAAGLRRRRHAFRREPRHAQATTQANRRIRFTAAYQARALRAGRLRRHQTDPPVDRDAGSAPDRPAAAAPLAQSATPRQRARVLKSGAEIHYAAAPASAAAHSVPAARRRESST